MIDVLRSFWNERAPRERAALAAMAAIVAAALAYLVLIEPAAQGIARLERGLPHTRSQAAQLDALLAEVKALKARPQVATVSTAEARAAIDRSLAAAGLKAARIVPLADGDLQFTLANVPFAAWSTWLAATERELGARAITVSANGTGTPGAVDVEMVLRLARR